MARSDPATAPGREPGVLAAKFCRLVAYLDEMGLDGTAIAAGVGLDRRAIDESREGEVLPALYYGLLYNEAVARLQDRELALPWGAGIGGTAFRLMAYCVIGCRTLGDALVRAGEFDAIVSSRIKGDRVELQQADGVARLVYRYRLLDSQIRFVPRATRTGDWPQMIGRASGLTVWHAFCGWLTGRALELRRVGVGVRAIEPRYRQKLEGIFHAPVEAVEGDSWLEFDPGQLEHKLVQDADSLEGLLRTGPYELLRLDSAPASTSSAIRSLLGNRFDEGLPGFEEIADRLGMSASSLRRRLMSENTSYQKLKDECRRDAAIRLLQAGELSVADIGERLGFTETSSFIRSFRSWTGATPRGFRDRLLAPR